MLGPCGWRDRRAAGSIGDGHGVRVRGRRGRQQLELALGADDLVGGADRCARSVAEAGPAVGADPDDGDPRGAHGAILTHLGSARHDRFRGGASRAARCDRFLDRRDEACVLARAAGGERMCCGPSPGNEAADRTAMCSRAQRRDERGAVRTSTRQKFAALGQVRTPARPAGGARGRRARRLTRSAMAASSLGVCGGGGEGGERERVRRPRRPDGAQPGGERRRRDRVAGAQAGDRERLREAADDDDVVEALAHERAGLAGDQVHEGLVDGDVRPGRRRRESACAGSSVPLGEAGLPTTTRSASSGTARGSSAKSCVRIAQHADDRDAVRAQRGFGLGEAGVHAGGEAGPERRGQQPQRLGGAVGGDDLVGVAAVERGDGGGRAGVVGVARRRRARARRGAPRAATRAARRRRR